MTDPFSNLRLLLDQALTEIDFLREEGVMVDGIDDLVTDARSQVPDRALNHMSPEDEAAVRNRFRL